MLCRFQYAGFSQDAAANTTVSSSGVNVYFKMFRRRFDAGTVSFRYNVAARNGSSGSVVPLFRRQLAAGEPLTVTHSEVTRYFMTIPEAGQLVLQAGAMATGGDVFVLDMGEPVKIIDLARRMVELSGLKVRDAANPGGDVEIAITGLRPGEKLYEELLIGDNPAPTAHPRIMKAHEVCLDWPELELHLQTLRGAAEACDVARIKAVLQVCVHGYGDGPSDES